MSQAREPVAAAPWVIQTRRLEVHVSSFDDDANTSDADVARIIEQVKPGFVIVRGKSTPKSDNPRAASFVPTPDLQTLRARGRAVGNRQRIELREDQMAKGDR